MEGDCSIFKSIQIQVLKQLLILSDHTMAEIIEPKVLITQWATTAKNHLDSLITSLETKFNQVMQTIDFPLFCIIYAIILIWVLRRVNRRRAFRPVNKQIQDWKSRVKKAFSTWLVSLPGVRHVVQGQFKKGIDQMQIDLEKDLDKDRDPHRSRKLPQQGMKKQNLQSRIHKWAEIQSKTCFSGLLSGSFYPDTKELCKEASDFGAKYMYHNPLHLDTYKQLSKLEAEVLKMTSSLISKNRTYGIITSGGSESLVMSLYAYKKLAGKQKPNIVVPCTIHAAIDKGAAYFNIEVRKARLNQLFQADVDHMEELIDSNTIALYCSYPNYPHGIVDPVQDIAFLAKKYKIPLHLDGCLGGFVAAFLPEHKNKFSLDIDGITSISLDHHKYALAPKGVATLFFKTAELRQQMYFFYTEWSGGIYGTPSFVGSRSGFASAGAWYCLTHVTKNVYKENAVLVSEAVQKAVKDLKKIDGVQVMGNPNLCVVAFNTTDVDVYAVCSYLQKKRGWHLGAIHRPKGIHISVTPANAQNVRDHIGADLAETIAHLRSSPEKQSSTAAVYGANAKLPSNDMGTDMLRAVMKVCFS